MLMLHKLLVLSIRINLLTNFKLMVQIFNITVLKSYNMYVI